MKRFQVGYTQGVFDMFHIGHLNLLNRAKAMCEQLIVGVNSDALVQEYKHKTPLIAQEERRTIVENIKAVDRAVIADTLDKTVAYGAFHFDAIFIGDDWMGNARWEETRRQMQALGVELIYLPYTRGIISSLLREMELHNQQQEMKGTS